MSTTNASTSSSSAPSYETTDEMKNFFATENTGREETATRIMNTVAELRKPKPEKKCEEPGCNVMGGSRRRRKNRRSSRKRNSRRRRYR